MYNPGYQESLICGLCQTYMSIYIYILCMYIYIYTIYIDCIYIYIVYIYILYISYIYCIHIMYIYTLCIYLYTNIYIYNVYIYIYTYVYYVYIYMCDVYMIHIYIYMDEIIGTNQLVVNQPIGKKNTFIQLVMQPINWTGVFHMVMAHWYPGCSSKWGGWKNCDVPGHQNRGLTIKHMDLIANKNDW